MPASAPTSKTAKKRASSAPLKLVPSDQAIPALPQADGALPASEQDPNVEQEGSDAPPAKPTIAKRRANRRQFEIPKVTFRRLVQEIAGEFKSDMRFQRDAYEALQEAAEGLVSRRFLRCSQLADLCKLDTVRDEHWRFVQDEAAGLLVPCSGRN